MLDTKQFGDLLNRHGFGFFAGVPCSFLKPLINYALNDQQYVIAANEGEAVAICAGAAVGGRKSVVLMQNSGLTNATSPLTSLIYTFRIPVLGFVSLRGDSDFPDEPQHELMGQITTRMLDLMQIPWALLSRDKAEAEAQVRNADAIVESGRPFFFVVRKDTFGETKLREQRMEFAPPSAPRRKSREDRLPKRVEVLTLLNEIKTDESALIATTGVSGRELYEVEDAPNNFYMVGSMGCASSFGLGLALARRDKKVVVIDGDGAILMRAGALSTIGYYRPSNMLHILLDNGIHDSTGGQATVSGGIDFTALASAMAYPQSIHIHDLDELKQEVRAWHRSGGLSFLYVAIAKGTKKDLGRPKVTPPQVRARFMEFLG